MCENKIIENLSVEKHDEMLLEIEPPKYWKYKRIADIAVRVSLAFYIMIGLENDSVFLEPRFLLLMLILNLGRECDSVNKAHKRINALVHLIKARAFDSKNT